MAEGSNRETVTKYFALLNARGWDEFEDLLEPDLVVEWPQSGERIRGVKNARSVLENYPAPPTGDVKRVVGAEDKWVVTPMFNPLRISGTGDIYIAESKTTYPAGDVWHTVDSWNLGTARSSGSLSTSGRHFRRPTGGPNGSRGMTSRACQAQTAKDR